MPPTVAEGWDAAAAGCGAGCAGSLEVAARAGGNMPAPVRGGVDKCSDGGCRVGERLCLGGILVLGVDGLRIIIRIVFLFLDI